MHPSQWAQNFERVMQNSGDYLFENAIKGWAYTLRFEAAHLNPALVAHTPIKEKQKSNQSDLSIPQGEKSAADWLDYFVDIKDPQKGWEESKRLPFCEEAVFLVDDFFEQEDLDAALKESVNGDGLNVVILGAGCIGLLLANMLKNNFGDDVNVLCIENRIQAPHVKKPYSRLWLTDLDALMFEPFDPQVAEIFKKFGREPFVGLTINIIETFLLLSCRKMGVKFLFSDPYDLGFVKDSKAHIVFDITGGRLQEISELEPAKPLPGVPFQFAVEVPSREYKDAYLKTMGITKYSPHISEPLTLKGEELLYHPHNNEGPMKMASIKLVNMPSKFYEPVLEQVLKDNEDNKLFVWEGALKPAYNEILLFINLTKEEYEAFAGFLNGAMAFGDFLADKKAQQLALDKRIWDVFDVIKSHATDDDLAQMVVEQPYLWEPYFHFTAGRAARLYGKPLIPLGDSIYNGSAKAGNGLWSHINFLYKMQELELLFPEGGLSVKSG